MPRFNPALLTPEELARHNHRLSSQQAAATARSKDLADAAEIKAEFAATTAEYLAEEKVQQIAKMQDKLALATAEVENAEAELAAMTPKDRATMEELGYDVYEGIKKAKMHQRDTERWLNHVRGLPRSAEQEEEHELQQVFLELSFKIGMPTMVREDILEGSSYEWDIVRFWEENIAKCERIMLSMQQPNFYAEHKPFATFTE